MVDGVWKKGKILNRKTNEWELSNNPPTN